jgi:lysozyme family protein
MTKNDILAAALVSGYPAGFRRTLSLVLDWECVYEADGITIRWEIDPDDPGGATFAGLLRKDGEVEEHPEAHRIARVYYHSYWQSLCGLPLLLQQVTFFMGVNLGIGTAIRLVQFSCNDYGARLIVDGKLGDKTRQAAFAVPDSTGLAMAFLAKCRRRYDDLVEDNTALAKFRKGWENRLTAAKGLLD